MRWAAFRRFEYRDLVRILQICTDVDVHGDTRHADARQVDKFGKIDVNFATDMDAGFAALTIMIPSSLKKPGSTRDQRCAK